jgi:hypothetical protein
MAKHFQIWQTQLGHMEQIELSSPGDFVLCNFYKDDEHIQEYLTTDPRNGEILYQTNLGYDYLNYQLPKIQSGHFNRGEANPLAKQLEQGQGHFGYSKEFKELKFLQWLNRNSSLTPLGRNLIKSYPTDKSLQTRELLLLPFPINIMAKDPCTW